MSNMLFETFCFGFLDYAQKKAVQTALQNGRLFFILRVSFLGEAKPHPKRGVTQDYYIASQILPMKTNRAERQGTVGFLQRLSC